MHHVVVPLHLCVGMPWAWLMGWQIFCEERGTSVLGSRVLGSRSRVYGFVSLWAKDGSTPWLSGR